MLVRRVCWPHGVWAGMGAWILGGRFRFRAMWAVMGMRAG